MKDFYHRLLHELTILYRFISMKLNIIKPRLPGYRLNIIQWLVYKYTHLFWPFEPVNDGSCFSGLDVARAIGVKNKPDIIGECAGYKAGVLKIGDSANFNFGPVFWFCKHTPWIKTANYSFLFGLMLSLTSV